MGNATVAAWDVLSQGGMNGAQQCSFHCCAESRERGSWSLLAWKSSHQVLQELHSAQPGPGSANRAFGSLSSALQAPLTNNCCFSEHHQELYSPLERDFIEASKEESSNYSSALHLGRKALTFWHMVRYWKQFPANTNF